MAAQKEIRGCGTALVTPFLANGSLDREVLASLVSWQIQEGIDFIVSCGTTGESPVLSREEVLEVVRITVQAAAGRIPIVAGAGGNNTAHAVESVRELEKEGVDAFLSVAPYYNKPSQEGLFRHYEAIAAATRLPVILYNVPGRTGSNILPDTVLRLAKIPNIIAVKEASGDIAQIVEICSRVPAGFQVFSGDDALTLPIMAVGGCGVISVSANEIPRMMTAMCHCCREGRWEEAREMNRKLLPLLKANFLESNPIPVKAALAMMGKIQEVYRLPLVKMGADNRARMAVILEELGLVKNSL
jgi:4-hydroxy-tetrahydrodipicolinate synthase